MEDDAVDGVHGLDDVLDDDLPDLFDGVGHDLSEVVVHLPAPPDVCQEEEVLVEQLQLESAVC